MYNSSIPTSPFYATRKMFVDYLNYTKPLSFDEWIQVESDSKAAVLFVQFFDEITLAWYKTKSFYAEDEDGVSTVLQYLIKNVPVIEADPKRFSARYIYRVAYNCLYCICHDIKRDKDRWEHEISNIVNTNDDEVDLFTIIRSDNDTEHEFFKDSFWKEIKQLKLSEDMQAFVYSLADLNPPTRISAEKRAIIAELRKILLPYADIFQK